MQVEFRMHARKPENPKVRDTCFVDEIWLYAQRPENEKVRDRVKQTTTCEKSKKSGNA